MKIISGGQTGVDRAALDVALKYEIECAGWCPAGRLDEFGTIPERYPVKELEHGGFEDRTAQNIKDSDGTVIIYFRKLGGGTKFTFECCKQLHRPYQLIDADKVSVDNAASAIGDFVRQYKIGVLNIAGPRQSEWPGGYGYAFRALEIFIGAL
jgi:Circularly permutated YpsA SLOG family